MIPRSSAVTAILIAAMQTAVSAQTAQLSGRISDATAAALRDALVTVTHTATGIRREVTSNDQGVYAVPFLNPGSYRVIVTAAGFKATTRDDLVLLVDENRRLDFELQLSELQQTVTVAASDATVHREDSSTGHVFEQPAIVNLPLNGRNYIQLAVLTAGAVPNPGVRVRSDGININGNRAIQNHFLIDGLDNNNYLLGAGGATTQAIRPSVDAIQEFKVETANYTAEQGGAAGGVISVVIKSGTNAVHGSGFEFFRHEGLESNEFFADRAGLAKPPLRYHQFGGTFGGPIVRNRAFFFASYQGTRERHTYTATVTVPTSEMIRGEFGDPIYDPLNVVDKVPQPFPNNTIPPDRIDPVGRRIAELFAAPNQPGLVGNFVGTVPRTDDRAQIDARVDVQATARSRLFARYSQSAVDSNQGSLFGPPGNGYPNLAALGDSQQLPLLIAAGASSLVVGHTQVLSHSLVNEFRAGYSANETNQRNPATRSLIEEIGLRGIPSLPDLTGLPNFDITGFGVLGDRSQLPFHPSGRVTQISDNVSWTRGAHAVKFGGEIRFKRNRIDNLPQSSGQFTFTGQFSGSGLADLLLGQTSLARLSTALRGDFRDRYFAAYVSDSWKAASSVTLTLGARYEVQTPMWEHQNRMTNFDSDPNSATFGTLVPATPGDIRSRAFSAVDLDNLAPRIGVNWQASRTTAVKGAYGLFYGGLGFQAALSTGLANVPYFVRTTIRSSLVLADGFQSDALDPAKVKTPDAFSLAAEQPMGAVHQWNVSLERQLALNTTLALTYVGSDFSHLRGIININAPMPGATRPFPLFGEIPEASSFVEGSYHALQVSADRRLKNGLAALSTYTWGHAIDNAADPADTGGSISPQNRTDLRAETASALYDVRHRFATSLIYESPARARPLLRDWRFAGIFVAQTGFPLTPTIKPNPAISTTTLRPDCVGDGNLPRSERTADRWFDVSAFRTPAPFTFGNCGRSVLRGPGYVNLDLLIARQFKIASNYHLEIRGEIFDLANSVHFGPPNTVVDLPDAGRITSTQSPPRQAQLGIRLVF